MRKPTPFVSLNDVPRDLLDGGGDLGACPEAGLCWPDDPLDKVIGYVSMLDDGFLEDLGLDFSLTESRTHRPVHDGGSDFSRRLPQGKDTEADTGAQVAPCEADDPGGWKTSACHVFDTVPEGLPQAPSLSCSPTSSGRRSLSSTTNDAEPQEHASEDDDGLRWTVLRKPHQRRANRRRHGWPSWTLALPLAFMSAAAHDDSSDNDDKDRDFELMSYCDNGGGGGGLPRPGAGRQRQRKQGGKHEKDKTCTHCRASDTPQWRAGPAGNSTLCNACGIRYKMGKLFPEYRPSNSPEFRSNEHSNRHRNVERIRQRKKLKVMAPEVLLNPHAAPGDKLLLQVCKYET
uniref:Uncharacterized protein n=1 Tax=Avena sativa TaxID=4498 RepID=A0ACD5WB89_AVESA